MKYIYIYILILIIITILIISIQMENTDIEEMIVISKSENPKWNRSSECTSKFGKIFETMLDNKNIIKVKNNEQSDLVFPCDYNNINNEIRNILKNNNNNIYFIIDGADEISAKNSLWKNILNYHGREKAKELSPITYLLYDAEDMKLLMKEHYEGKIYIMKKNIQRQQGLKIASNIKDVLKNEGGYVIAQELLQDPYLINDRKINLRIYILVLCHKGNTDVFMYNDGFMYYTKQDYKYGDYSDSNHITTGYVERDIYTKNPLTHKDFKRYLDMDQNKKYHPTSKLNRQLNDSEQDIRNKGMKISTVVFNSIQQLLSDIFITFNGKICTQNSDIYSKYSAQLFGVDIAINDKLNPIIMEINKGPDLSPKDDRDRVIKESLVKDTLDILGLIKNNTNNGFIRILEI